jgi:hypothetical protein
MGTVTGNSKAEGRIPKEIRRWKTELLELLELLELREWTRMDANGREWTRILGPPGEDTRPAELPWLNRIVPV